MTLHMRIRRADLCDADAISHLIISTLQSTNSKDYSDAIIREVINNFTPDRVRERIDQREVFVAYENNVIIGTASLDNDSIRSVFVSPNMQGNGIGRSLVDHLENTAKAKDIRCLTVPSSITAEQFYLKLGFKAVRDEYHGEERIIIMEKYI